MINFTKNKFILDFHQKRIFPLQQEITKMSMKEFKTFVQKLHFSYLNEHWPWLKMLK